MTTSHVIAVPVDTLDIVDAPGHDRMQYCEDQAESPGESTNTFSISLTLRTSASKVTFKRTVTIWWVSLWEQDENGVASTDEYAHFQCQLGGEEFEGAFNLRTRQGKLTAYHPKS